MPQGGLLQVVAYGAQNVYLTASPEITYFKISYRRHTNFAIESVEIFFQGQMDFNKKSNVEIQRSGDLVSDILFRATLPEVRYESKDFGSLGHVSFAWVRRVGHALVDEIEFQVGSGLIDKHYGDWLNIWYDLTHDVGKEYGYAKMIGDVPELTEVKTLSWDSSSDTVLKPSYDLYVPMQFSFCRNNGLALPLISLQYHTSQLTFKLRDVRECYIASDAFKCNSGKISLENASLWVDYVYLDNEERKKFAQSSHEYLIEQLQFTGSETINNGIVKAKLSFNHPTKAIYWVAKLGNYKGGKFMAYDHCDWERARDSAARSLLLARYDMEEHGYLVDTALETGSYTASNGVEYVSINPTESQYEPTYVFDTTAVYEAFSEGQKLGVLSDDVPLMKRDNDEDLRNKVEGVVRIYMDSENDNWLYMSVDKVTRNDLNMYDLSIPVDKYQNDNRNQYIKSYDLYVWLHHSYGLLINGKINPISEVLLQLNGSDRQTQRSGFWHDTIDPFKHNTDTPPDGLNVYSFGLHPEDHQPSGACNFSRIDTANLNLKLAALAGGRYSSAFNDSDSTLDVFAFSYNIFRVVSGMGGLAFS